jgi:hypothetical protein
MGVLRSKRGAIEVSVNTIIILIFAIAILGLGLTFVRKSMGSATSEFGKVTDELRTDMMNTLKQSGEKLTLKPAKITLSKSNANLMTGEVFYGIRNLDTAAAVTFGIDAVACESIDGGSIAGLNAKTFTTLKVDAGASDVQPIKVTITSATPATSYKCTLTVRGATQTLDIEGYPVTIDGNPVFDVYASQNFFVDVTD